VRAHARDDVQITGRAAATPGAPSRGTRWVVPPVEPAEIRTR